MMRLRRHLFSITLAFLLMHRVEPRAMERQDNPPPRSYTVPALLIGTFISMSVLSFVIFAILSSYDMFRNWFGLAPVQENMAPAQANTPVTTATRLKNICSHLFRAMLELFVILTSPRDADGARSWKLAFYKACAFLVMSAVYLIISVFITKELTKDSLIEVFQELLGSTAFEDTPQELERHARSAVYHNYNISLSDLGFHVFNDSGHPFNLELSSNNTTAWPLEVPDYVNNAMQLSNESAEDYDSYPNMEAYLYKENTTLVEVQENTTGVVTFNATSLCNCTHVAFIEKGMTVWLVRSVYNLVSPTEMTDLDAVEVIAHCGFLLLYTACCLSGMIVYCCVPRVCSFRLVDIHSTREMALSDLRKKLDLTEGSRKYLRAKLGVAEAAQKTAEEKLADVKFELEEVDLEEVDLNNNVKDRVQSSQVDPRPSRHSSYRDTQLPGVDKLVPKHFEDGDLGDLVKAAVLKGAALDRAVLQAKEESLLLEDARVTMESVRSQIHDLEVAIRQTTKEASEVLEGSVDTEPDETVAIIHHEESVGANKSNETVATIHHEDKVDDV